MGSRNMFLLYFVTVEVVLPILCAPKGIVTYDQKQTGEYNVQLHMKDFQIIALMSDDSFALGDYDYNYDYSDLTVKPPGFSTAKPQLNASIATVIGEITASSTEKPLLSNLSTSTSSSEDGTGNSTIPSVPVASSDANTPPYLGPDKIHVKVEKPVTSVAIVPSSEEAAENNVHQQYLGAIVPMPSSKCSNGFIRDKKGRCRRIRRPPHLQYGLSRLATSLASKFRRNSAPSPAPAA